MKSVAQFTQVTINNEIKGIKSLSDRYLFVVRKFALPSHICPMPYIVIEPSAQRSIRLYYLYDLRIWKWLKTQTTNVYLTGRSLKKFEFLKGSFFPEVLKTALESLYIDIFQNGPQEAHFVQIDNKSPKESALKGR